MAINVNYEKLYTKKLSLSLKDTVKVECKTGEVLSGSKILSARPVVFMTGEEVFDGQIRYSGKIIFSVCFINENGLPDCAECATEFANTVKNDKIKSSMQAKIFMRVLKTDLPDFTGNLSASVAVLTEIELYNDEEFTYATGGDNVITRRDAIKISRPLGIKSSAIPVEEEFELNYPVSNVLFHFEDAYVLSATCGIGCIIIDGEAEIKAYLLQNAENSDILKETRVFPFRVEIDYPDAMPTMGAVADISIKDARYEVVVDEETGKSRIEANLTVLAYGEAVDKAETEIALDAFSKSNELELETLDVTIDTPKTGEIILTKFNERASISPEPDPGARIMTTAIEDVTLASYATVDGVFKADAVIFAKTFYKDTDGIITSVAFSFPLEISEKLPDGCQECEVVGAKAIATDINARFVSLSEVEAFGTLKLLLKTRSEKQLHLIKNINPVSEKQPQKSAISVYIATSGEDLWTLSKRLNISPEEVLLLNPELEFPLSGDERIIIYRQTNKEY